MSQSLSQPTEISVPALASVIELLKPITWFAPMWAFGCGIVSSGASVWDNLGMLVLGVLLSGPLVCGTSQAVNDWYDRHVDAINEPNRPIPSGRIPGRWGINIGIFWTGLSLLVAAEIGTTVFFAALFGVAAAWAYSMPPLRFKKNGWLGNSAVAICYEGLPWFTGAAIMVHGVPSPAIIALALLYSFGAHGIMTLNDFKSVEGDREMGLLSLPVQLGVGNAARLACGVMAAPQIIVIGFLVHWEKPFHALGVAALLGVQIFLMRRLLKDPKKEAAFYNATGTTLYVLGMLASAFAVRTVTGGL